MDDEEDTKQFRFMCLQLACSQTKSYKNEEDGQHYSSDLTGEEAVAMADQFYKFLNKKELN